MTPPPMAALALLGGTIFMMLWATTRVRTPGSRIDDGYESIDPDTHCERSDWSTDDGRSARSFSDADD
ncbi:hypothetical protein [Natrinema amylolyticum]|uniref:hypothetical protein n=1 Tax=Natrinema amylolyticum TaxID=2878679 RepID=UPI001CF9CE67|nr:hypothetical protein [Natrinema amylolyticum]